MAGRSILNINTLPTRDDTIIRKEIYPYEPFTTSFASSEEIRIAIQSQDSYLLPCESYLYLKITATTTGVHGEEDAEVTFVNNFISFLFDDVRYELNGVEIDRLRNVGRASTMKLLSASRTSQLNGYNFFCKSMEVLSPRSERPNPTAAFPTKEYDIVIPLSAWFGFCDDYRKIVLNARHVLILNRSRDSLNCVVGGGAAFTASRINLTINKIQWKMPHVTLADSSKLKMLNYLSKNRKIVAQYRSMDLIEYPTLPQTPNHLWAVKTVSHVHRPRYVIVGLQTNRNRLHTVDASKFDTCHITSVRLHMNSQIYPYNLNDVVIGGGIYSELYNMYIRIQSSYYNDSEGRNPFQMKFGQYQECPLFTFDTTYADESLIGSSVDIKVEIKASENMPANTSAFCLIVYDNEFTYSPFDSVVVRGI